VTARPPLERAFAFERAMLGAVGRVVTASWGQAFLTPSLDRVYDRNVVWVVGDGGGASAVEVDGHAERLLSGHRMDHRRVLLEPAADARIGAELVERCGYTRSAHVFMVLDGTPAAAPDGAAGVVEASVAAVDAGCSRYLETDPDTAEYGRDPRTREQLLEHHRAYGPSAGAERRFAVLDDSGVAVAWARLWRRGSAFQIEDVVCLAEHRGHGHGRAVVAAATHPARAAGAPLLFIVADAGDWPRDLYARMGFTPAGELAIHQRFAPR
jgi:N-acetylglutamate synthase-like GNAT family acetyltransferase